MGEPVRKVKTCFYLGSVVTKGVGTEQDTKKLHQQDTITTIHPATSNIEI
jgi:hypothetical protein